MGERSAVVFITKFINVFKGVIDKEEIMTAFQRLGVQIDQAEAEKLLRR